MHRNKEPQKEKEGTKPDRETLNTTDPQENMEGPMSSPTKDTGKVFDSDENKKNADERRERRM